MLGNLSDADSGWRALRPEAVRAEAALLLLLSVRE